MNKIIKTTFLISIVLLLINSCTDSNNSFIATFENEINVKIGDTASLYESENSGEGTLIRPYFAYTAISEDTNIAYVLTDDQSVYGNELGSTIITVYGEENEILKKIKVNVIANYTLTLKAADIFSLKEEIPEIFANEGKHLMLQSEDGRIAYIDYPYGDVIYTGTPGRTYIKSTMFKTPVIEVNVESFQGTAPFEIPNVKDSDSLDNVELLMADYTKTESGFTYFNHIRSQYVSYAPYGNAKNITFYFQYDNETRIGNLEGFEIETNESSNNNLNFLFSNFEYGSTKSSTVDAMTMFNPIVYNYFKAGNWFITSDNTNDKEGWENLIFKLSPTDVKVDYTVIMKAGTKITLTSISPDFENYQNNNLSQENRYVADIDMGYLYAGNPGIVYLTNNPYSDSNSLTLEVIVEPYSGKEPFIIPKVKKGNSMDLVKELMKDYTIKDEGTKTINYISYDYILFSSGPDSENITFYFKNNIFSGDSLEFITIEPEADVESIFSYCCSNYSIHSSGYSSALLNLFNGSQYFYFETDEWNIYNETENGVKPWTVIRVELK
ncbi:MAG: hypothetical protein J1F67_07020 [Muribaculaceae bacterium]|nr:hypothetical protein [Muribaculaceae bacterium]